MKRLILLISALLVLLLAACSTAQPVPEQPVGDGDKPVVTVYHPPT